MRTDLPDHDEDSGIVPGYRPVSGIAFFALLAGILSAAVLVSSALLVIPLIASALSVVALMDVSPRGDGDERSEREDRKTGRWLALAGLALAVGFGTQAVVTGLMQRSVAFSRAEGASRMFLDMVRADRMGDAVKVCLAQVYPPSKMSGFGAKPTPDVQELQAEASLAGMEVIRAIQGCGTAAPIDLRCEGAEARFPDSWAVRVRIGPCEGGGKPLRLKMLMQSKPVTRGKRQFDNWMVAGIASDPAE
jgi:hypothetical protein